MKGKRIHFCGVAGTGLSSLARLARWRGARVSGSDRDFDRNRCRSRLNSLRADGIIIVPQNGAGASGADLVVSSAAVESEIPDLAEARRMGVPVVSRADFLCRLASQSRRLAVAGTNGKSSVTALLAWILHRTGRDPTVALGAALRGDWGGVENARAGNSAFFCFEADESDGGLPRYRPEVGLVTNISRDHFPLKKLQDIFSEFAASTTGILVLNGDNPASGSLAEKAPASITFALDQPADLRARNLVLGREGLSFTLGRTACKIPLLGRHSAANSLAALAAAGAIGIKIEEAAEALRDFPGLERRLEVVGRKGDVTVLDDYAHNPAKIKAALAAGRLLGKRLIVVYRPHGFGPLRSLLSEYAEAFGSGLMRGDVLLLLPVYDAGGTADRSINSAELAQAIAGEAPVLLVEEAVEAARAAAKAARRGSVVIVMGARDPALPDLSRKILGLLEAAGG